MMRTGAVVFLALAVTACAEVGTQPGPGPSLPPPPPRTPVAAIIGHGAYRTRSGAHGDCTGQSVALMRDTPGFRQRVTALYGSPESARLPVASVKARSAKLGPAEENTLVESAQCGGGGAFGFRAVAPGSYFIIARVKVTTVLGAAEDLVIMRHVALADGEIRDVSLAP